MMLDTTENARPTGGGARLLPLFVCLALVLCFPHFSAAREKLRVGVAANYIAAFQEISAAFTKETGVDVDATFASSGTLYAQITSGAPYDVFLSADEERPNKLFGSDLAEKPFRYAHGRCVLWSAKKEFCRAKDWRAALAAEGVKRIALANPETAPYGAAARQALQQAGLWESLKKKCVIAQDIAQAFQYAATGAVDGSFCALSATVTNEGAKGCFFTVAEAPEIVQTGCILKRTDNRPAAERFAVFLLSPQAEAIKSHFGYK